MHGASFYGDNDVFNTCMPKRQRTETPNDTIEKPVMMELIRTSRMS